MKKLLSFLLALTLSLSLATFALADDDGGSSAQFDPEVTVEENGSTMTVTLSSKGANDEILASKRPTLTVACDYARAVVTDPNGVRIESTLSGGKISFVAAMGGAYTITRVGTSAPSSKPADSGKNDGQQPDDGTYVNPYPDVQAGDWYSGAVQFVTEEKLMTGTGKGFEPNAATTRAMLWTILARMDGADTNGCVVCRRAGLGGQAWRVRRHEPGRQDLARAARDDALPLRKRAWNGQGGRAGRAQRICRWCGRQPLRGRSDALGRRGGHRQRYGRQAEPAGGGDPRADGDDADALRKARCIKREQNEKGVPLEGKRNSFFAKFRYSARSALYDSPEALPFSFFQARATIRCARRRESPLTAGGRMGCQTRPRRASAPRRRGTT